MLYPDRNLRILIPLAAMLMSAAILAVGCSKRNHELVPVTGKAVYEGKPLRFGSVMFQPEWGQPATAEIQPDGSFRLVTRGEGDGAAVGLNRVRIACFEAQDPTSSVSASDTLGRLLIPARYLSFQSSGFSVEVLPKANEPVLLELTP